MTMARSEDCGPVSISGSRADGRFGGLHSLKKLLLDCCAALLSQGTSGPREKLSVLIAAFRSGHGIAAGSSIVLIRWIGRAALVGSAARARPCGHAFLVLRFLPGRTGIDGSVIGRAGCSLALSRRKQRGAEERRNDKSRDCKFGSHQKYLRSVAGPAQRSGGELVPARGKHFEKNHSTNFFWRSPREHQFILVIAARTSSHLTNIRHLPNISFAQSDSMVCAHQCATNVEQDLTGGWANVRDSYQESPMSKMRRNDVVADRRA
jgi:hypothetical protein